MLLRPKSREHPGAAQYQGCDCVSKGKERNLNSLDGKDLQDFLSYLAVERKVSASTQNQALNAIVFLYRHVFDKDIEGEISAVRAKQKRRLPVVLTVEEAGKEGVRSSGLCLPQIFEHPHPHQFQIADAFLPCEFLQFLDGLFIKSERDQFLFGPYKLDLNLFGFTEEVCTVMGRPEVSLFFF